MTNETNAGERLAEAVRSALPHIVQSGRLAAALAEYDAATRPRIETVRIADLEWSHTLNNGERMAYAQAEAACAALGEGWRLPTRAELESIIDLSRHDPAIDTDRFPDTQSGAYWTSTPCAWAPSCAWVVGFYNGYVDFSHRGYSNAFVRAVRSAASPAGERMAASEAHDGR